MLRKRNHLLIAFLLLAAAVMGPATRQIVPESPIDASPAIDSSAHLGSAPVRRVAVSTRSRRVRPTLLAQAITTQLQTPPSATVSAVFDQPDIQLKHQEMAEEVKRILPVQCQDTLKSFFVRYDNPENRGLAGKTTMIVSGNVPDDEYRALLVHEFGHIMDLGCLQGDPSSGPSAFTDGDDPIWSNDPSISYYTISWKDDKTKRDVSSPSDFVSGYAQWDPFEDLAETVTAYVLHHDALMALAQKNQAIAAKVWWIQTYLFPQDPKAAASTYVWQGPRPWDMTKLPYTWDAKLTWN